MPHLTLEFSPNGPIIDIIIGVSGPRKRALTAQGAQVPPPVQIRALVDTGASCTCIDPQILSGLNLSRTGVTQMHSTTTGATPVPHNLFDVSLVLLNPKINYTMHVVSVAEVIVPVPGTQALIGRDVLKNCLLIYDGQHKTFTLSF